MQNWGARGAPFFVRTADLGGDLGDPPAGGWPSAHFADSYSNDKKRFPRKYRLTLRGKRGILSFAVFAAKMYHAKTQWRKEKPKDGG
jgi:hypothetical protein